MPYCHEEFAARTRDLCNDLAELVIKKNKAYGNSYAVVPEIMKLLYPDGVKPDQIENMLLLVRIMDKIKRIVENNDPFGENPFTDIAGYGLVALVAKELQKEEK